MLRAPADDLPARTLVLLGDGAATGPALRLAAARGWPVVAEPSSGASGPNVVDAGELVLDALAATAAPERVLVVGRPTLSRVLGRLVATAPVDVVGEHGGWADPPRRAARVLPGVPAPDGGPVEPGWLETWTGAGLRAREAVERLLAATPGLPEPVVAAAVLAAAGDLLLVGSSKPVRDLFLAGARPEVRVLANRGAAGIDGLVSTAVGAALARQADGAGPAYALLGDLSLLHDSNGFVLGPDEPRPDLTVVVVNNDGGAIFGLLEQAGPGLEEAFERVFGTPHGVDLAALCAATRTPHALVTDRGALATALAATGGLRVVEVRTDRHAAAALDRAVRAAARAALG